MKILQVLEATLGGTARHILDLSEGLLALGHEVHLLYSSKRADQVFLMGLERLRRDTRFFSLEVPMDREVRWSDIQAYRQISRYVSIHGPFAVIHSHSTKAGFLARLLGEPKGTRRIYTPHGLMTQSPSLRGLRKLFVRLLEASLARRCDDVIAVSNIERDCAVQTGIPRKKITVIPNGLKSIPPAQRDAVRNRLGIPTGVVCIGSIGLLVPNKAHGRLLDAIQVLKQTSGVPVCVLLIGWGSSEQSLRAQMKRQGLDGIVKFLGQVSGIEHMPAFDILAHPSLYEGFAYTFLEALQLGIPIVTTRVGGAPETVEHGQNGFLCDPWDTKIFASYLKILTEDETLRKHMSERAIRHAPAFTAKAMVRSTLQCYTRDGHPSYAEAHGSSTPLLDSLDHQ